MLKNLVIGLLVIVVLGEGFFLMKRQPAANVAGVMTPTGQPRPSGAPPGGRIPLLSKGDNLSSSPLMQFAYKIAPGDIPAASQKVLTGFSIKSTPQADGSVTVTLIPKDSDDQFQQYIVKPGNMLYFIEMTPADDKQDQDKDTNYRDDYGIITDANGIVQ